MVERGGILMTLTPPCTRMIDFLTLVSALKAGSVIDTREPICEMLAGSHNSGEQKSIKKIMYAG